MPEHDASTTIRDDFERVSAEVIAAARGLPSATLHEASGRTGALPAAIKPVARGFKVCGPAYTVHSPGGDNLWLHRALARAKPGDVLVVHVSGAYEYGYWGEIMTTAAQARGLNGLVINGGVRDVELLETLGFPVFARGVAIRGTGKDYGASGWLGAPLRLGDVTVAAGDLIVGDSDGIVALSRTRAAQAVERAHQREASEAAILKRLQAGETTMQIYGFH